jgi:hypothetical protein
MIDKNKVRLISAKELDKAVITEYQKQSDKKIFVLGLEHYKYLSKDVDLWQMTTDTVKGYGFNSIYVVRYFGDLGEEVWEL